MLSVIGEEVREVDSTFMGWEHESDSKKPSWSLNSSDGTVSPGRTFLLSTIVSIVVARRLGKATIGIAHHF